jgi:hypothetical protein
MPVPILKVVAETPEVSQGETTLNPSPVPNARTTKVTARDATEPTNIAPQEAPETDGSSMFNDVIGISVILISRHEVGGW